MSEERWAVPETWVWASMGEIAEIVGGGTPSTSDGGNFAERGIPWLTPADLTGYGQTYIARGRRDLSEKGYRASAARLMPTGTVLFSSRAPIGYCAVASGDITTNQGFKSFILRGEISPEYVRHYLLSSVDYAESKASGTTFKELSGSRAAELSAPIAPLPEQQRIVAKIDSLTGKSKRARERLAHIPRLVEKYKQAVLAAAFRGDLTREWRRTAGVSDEIRPLDGMPNELLDRPLPISWTPSTMALVATNHDGRRVPVRASDRAATRGRYPYYGASGIIDYVNDYLFDGQFLLIGEDGANLLSRSTPIAFLAEGQFWVNNHAHILQANDQTSNEWLRRFMNMISLAPYVTGSAQPKLTQSALNRIGIPLPPLEEQTEILRRVETAFIWIDRLASEATSARRLIDHLDQSVLAKAFRGELVPQDPADEPASILLERIKAQRSPARARARGPRM